MNIGMQVKYGLEKVWRSELSNNAKMLYVELFIECNNNFWEEIEISSKELQRRLNIKEIQLRRARKELIEEGYIIYTKGINKNIKSTYDIVEKIKNDGVIDGVVDGVIDDKIVGVNDEVKKCEKNLKNKQNLDHQNQVNDGVVDGVIKSVTDCVIDDKNYRLMHGKASNNKYLRTL